MEARAAARPHPRGASALPEQTDDDLLEVWPVLLASARHLAEGRGELRAAAPPGPALRAALAAAAEVPVRPDAIRAFLCGRFACTTVDQPGFLTGYYEPVVEASPVRTDDFVAPVLPWPADRRVGRPATGPGVSPAASAHGRGRRTFAEPLPDRAAIEDGALAGVAAPILWLRDWVELFLVQVQGSARVRLPDGSERSLIYDGRNGQPYTSVGRYLIETGRIQPDAMSLDTLKAWLRAHGQQPGEAGRDAMQRNRSFVFFRLAPSDPGGPIGGAGVPLTPGRSVAIDRAEWPYGLPVLVETDAALPGFGAAPLRRLFVAQDTGSAIVGPARLDLFLGSGEAAGRDAGRIRHPGRVTPLLPRP